MTGVVVNILDGKKVQDIKESVLRGVFFGLVCCAVSAPSEGIAVTGRKNYLFEGFCLFEEKIPKVAEASLTSFYNVEDDQFPDCVNSKITYRLSFFKNFFINQYQNRKNNYCSIMDSVLERKKKESGSSVELTYRKRNLLWTRKGMQSLKTIPNLSTTTLLPLEKHTLNYIEKKRFFALKKAKTHKRKRVRRYTRRRHSVRRPKTLREQISFNEPTLQLSNVITNDYFEGRLRKRGQAFPLFRYLGKFIEFKKNRGNRGSVLKNILRGREWAGGEATHVGCTVPKDCRNYVLKKHRENARSVKVRSLNRENPLLTSNFDGMDDLLPRHVNGRFIYGHRSKKIRSRLDRFRTQLKTPPLMRNRIPSLNQLVYDSRLKGNDKINFENDYDLSVATDSVGLNECEDDRARRSNKKGKNNDYDNELNISESYSDGSSEDADYPSDEEHFKTKKEMEDFFRKILKASADYSTDLKGGFNLADESKESYSVESTTKKSFLKPEKLKKEMPITDFDFPDYDEVYDAATDILLKNYTPSHFHKSREFKFQKNVFSKKRHLKNRQKLKSRPSNQTSMNLKRSLLFKKSLEREKKFCGSRCSSSCGIPHRCWKSAPLLCIPYIRKGQDDLLRYLISVMQKMLGKPYPQKIDIFENTKYKPCLKKSPQTTCEDIIPQEAEDDDDDVDNCDTNPCKTTPHSCNPCSHSYPTTPAPCPNACPPVPTPCPPSCSFPKDCSKNSNDPSCPSFPCPLPNLNQIYTEPTPCPSDKCFSTLPPFLLPLSSIIQSGAKTNSPELKNTPSPTVKPTPSTMKSMECNPNKDATVSLKAPNHSESVTFFPPKNNSPGYVKEDKEINSESLAGDDQSDQQLSDKILPEFEDYQEEMKLLNLTETTLESESTLVPSTGSEPLLLELPKLFGDEKHGTDFSNSNVTDSFARKDLKTICEYNDQILESNNPTNFSSNASEPAIHRIPLKEKDHSYKPLSTTENDVYGRFPATHPGELDKPQTGKPLHAKHTLGKSVKSKKKHSLKRLKREDNYNNIGDFINYDGYLYDTNDNSEDYGKRSLQQLEGEESNSDVNRLADDYGWTPLQFEMFSELAKKVTETEANVRSSLGSVSAVPEPSPTDSPVKLCSSTGSQLEKSSVAVTTEKISTTVLPKEKSTIKAKLSAETQQSDTSSECKQTEINNKTRYNPRSSSTVEFQDFRKTQEKEVDVNSYLDTTEDGQLLTTIGTAYIVKGPKKQMTKPCPKIYTKVYPDSVPVENEKTDTTAVTTTDTAPKRSILLKATPAMTSVTPDIRLQLLAVCEGYLEVVKFVKSQNQSFGGELDSDLSSYCENIISQSFSQQTESSKIKKQEVNLSATEGTETLQNALKKVGNLTPESKSYESSKPTDPVLKRDLDDNPKVEDEKFDKTNAERNETAETPRWQKKPNVKKSKRKKKEHHFENQKLREGDDEFLKKGMTKEQVELLSILKKRKRALLNWLFNSKEDQVQPEVEETEYFDDDNGESAGNSLNLGNNSGTVRPRGAKSSVNTEKVPVTTKDSVIPVYAKEYGYDKGGELKQVEVLWQKVNDETHEVQTFKNLSVLALVLTSTIPPDVEKKKFFFDVNGYVNEDVSEIRTKKENNVGFAAEERQGSNNCSVAVKSAEDVITALHCNSTVTYVNRPDASSIVGTVINHTINTTKHPNITRKIAGKLNKAKGIVEEYTIEFWNYAVYILPIMFSILFLFCCACCAIHILRNNRRRKKKKKKKKFESTDDSSEESDSEPKKKRRDKSKKSKNIWKVWKKNPNKSCLDINDEANSAEKKKSFLRFLKSKKNDKAEEGSSVPYCALPESDGAKGDNQSETAERRELIALLEELKKIEMEQVGEKKEQKSVHVQYMIQDHDESAFKSPEMAKNYPFYSKNCSFHESRAEEYGIYKDAELKELLPCECGYSSKKRDYLRNYGFRGNEESRCQRFFNIFRNAGLTHHQYEKKKKFTEKDRNFIFDKYRTPDINDERNEAGFTVKMCDMSQFNLPEGNPNDWVGEVEHFKNQMMKKKHVRLKDDGVLCRL